MAKKSTVAALTQKVEQLLTIQEVADRYKELCKEIKSDMVALGKKGIEIAGKGRVEITQSTKTEYPIALVNKELGLKLANKVIQTNPRVSNKLVAAFIKTGDISPKQAEKLKEGAKETPSVSLYVRPLK